MIKIQLNIYLIKTLLLKQKLWYFAFWRVFNFETAYKRDILKNIVTQ